MDWKTMLSYTSGSVDESGAPGPETCQARYAAVALASILGLSGGLFSAAAQPWSAPTPLFGANLALENRD